jgi:hypothetical protein
VRVSLIVRDVETSTVRPPRPELGCWVTNKQNREAEYIYKLLFEISVAHIDKMFDQNELEINRKETVVLYLKLLFHH